MQFVLALPEHSRQALYKQVCEALRLAIEEGRLRVGEKLPSTRELASAAKISRFTAIRSYELLTAQGLIHTIVGSGTFVADKISKSSNHVSDPIAEPSLVLVEPSFSIFGKRMLQSELIEPADAELFQELNYGAPSINQLPLRQWREVLNKCARFEDKTLFQYVSDPMGYLHLREAISAYLTRARSVKCSSSRVALFSGTQSGVDLVCRLLLDPGDIVALENPGFPGARRILNTHGAKIVTIPVDNDGLIVDELYKLKSKVKMVYVTPSHQDPMGVVMSVGRRMELLKWAQLKGAFILEDDYDSEYHYGEKPVSALQGMDQADSVIYIGSFWKVLFPVVRVAFLVLPKRLLAPMHRAKSSIERDFPLLEQIALTEFLNEGILERQIKRTKALYAKRRAALALVLAKRLKDLVAIYGVSAGMHMILQFDPSLPVAKILRCIREAGVPMVSTEKHYVGDPKPHEFMIGFAHHSEEELSALVEHFADLLSLK
jgi:GntR family transcriptional regulator/MocR family aminotransferase